MNADGTLRATKFPRGLILSTGEDVPAGLSLRARMLTLEMSPGAVNMQNLTLCQQAAAAGVYAQSLSGFLAWLAPRYEDAEAELREHALFLRQAAQASGQHRRTPGIVAELGAALRLFLRFAVEVGAVTEKGQDGLWEQGWWALGQAADAQATHQAASEPTARYRELLAAAVAAGRAHVAGQCGNTPKDPQAWGWRAQTFGAGDHERTEWSPQGERVGWLDGNALYLEPDAAHAVARRLGDSGGDGLTISAKTLHKRLQEHGLLVSIEDGRGTLTVRRVLEGQRRRVLHLRGDFLNAGSSSCAAPAQSAQTAPANASGRVKEEAPGQSVGQFPSAKGAKSAQEPAPVQEPSRSAGGASGRNRQIGQDWERDEAREVWRP